LGVPCVETVEPALAEGREGADCAVIAFVAGFEVVDQLLWVGGVVGRDEGADVATAKMDRMFPLYLAMLQTVLAAVAQFERGLIPDPAEHRRSPTLWRCAKTAGR
jgi:hypothetical protein